jgi:hypothetical protein
MDYEGDVPGAGIVSGIGIVSGREVIIHADDASVKGGAWYPLSVKKIVRTLDIAIENRLPVMHHLRQRRRLPAVAGGTVRRPLSMPAASSATRRSCRRWVCRRSPWCSATARRAAPMCRR